MRFLSVAEREMRAASRRSVTYFTRWLTGLVFLGLLIWLLWVMDGFRNRRVGPELLEVFSILIFFYSLILGTARTADCLSVERREGTLGLLFLTNLNSAEIVLGKLCSHALATTYGLLAIFPILALPLLMGGITFDDFGRMVLALLNAVLCALATGLAASVLFTRQFPAVAFATGMATLWGAGLLGVAAIVHSGKGSKALVELLAVGCPFYSLLVADGRRMFGSNYYWQSLATVAAMSLACIGWVTWRLARSWRDRPQVTRAELRWQFWRRWRWLDAAGRARFRQRLLDINPFYWLAGRKLVSAPVFMLVAFVVVVITAYVTTPYFAREMGTQSHAPMLGSMVAWVCTAMALHALVLYYAAMIASQRLAEDKQAGVLEMILCTPTTERSISRGLWLAFARRMVFPAGVAILAHCFFLWQCMILATMHPPGKMPPGVTSGEYFWAVLWNTPVRGYALDWSFVFLIQIVLLLLVVAPVVWGTLGWVGRWLGLRMKHPGFAPMLSLALVFGPPILVFSLICYVFDETGLTRMPERKYLPLLMWVALGVGLVHCAILCRWAAGCLRRDFRVVVTSRFQPPASRPWWRPSWRGIGRFMVRVGATAAALILLVLAFYGYQNWRSQREWKQFQTERAQRGEAQDFPLAQPPPVAAAENLAQHPAFQRLSQSTVKQLLPRMNELDLVFQRYTGDALVVWPQRMSMPLSRVAIWFKPGRTFGVRTNNAEVAPELLENLAGHRDLLRELAVAARRSSFQITTNVTPVEVIRSVRPETTTFERMQFLFVLRAAAAVEVGDTAMAAEDVVTSLKLAHLARQTADARASIRQQVLLLRSFQPFWEGLRQHRWNDAQLTEFQRELARFDLFADHTNAIHRVVSAYAQIWQKFPRDPEGDWAVPEPEGGFLRESNWAWQPRSWWYDRCRQIYDEGQSAISRVNFTNGTVHVETEWNVLEGLPVGNDIEILLEPYYWGQSKSTILASAQTALQQARLAAALERHWLTARSYPNKLEELVPEHLERVPSDVVSGRPMLYERLTPDHYVLRSVGPDGEDDRKSKSADDWLWAYPTNATPAVVAPAQ
jgi:ABC-type transport system involved in cytochrome c biogenesis permease component